MSEADRQKALEHIIFERYMPAFNVKLARFLHDYSHKQKQAIELSQAIGIPIHLPPSSLDLRDITEQLIVDLHQYEVMYTKHKEK